MRAFVIRGENTVNIYSRRMELKTANFPEHVKLFRNIMPICSVLDCEVVANDDPDLIKTIFGTGEEKAIERQKNQKVEFIVFDVLYWDGDDVSCFPYGPLTNTTTRYSIMARGLSPLISLERADTIRLVENLPNRPTNIPREWEGLVLKDKSSSTKIRWDGKPDRKSGTFKIKNFKEADLVCYEWMKGKGKLNDDVATLKLGMYDAWGTLVHVCESGSGLTDALRQEIRTLSPFGKFKKFTVEIKYEEVTPGKSLRLPILLRLRPDKAPRECVLVDIGINQ
jgi:ATP-dependent DNA ligase